MSRWRPFETVATLLLLATIATGDSLTFVSPKAPATGQWLNYTAGDRINVTWTSDFNETTLKVWEGPLTNGSYAQEILVGQ